MSSRKEEKERLRREREEAERAAMASEGRRKRLAIVLGSVLAIAVAVVIVLAVVSGGDDDGGDGSPTSSGDGAALPATKTTDLDEAVKTAGCKITEQEDEGNQHLAGNDDTYDDYKANPPTSGTHRPVAAADGEYEPGNSPEPENWVHTLEHGRVILQYKPGTPQRRIDQLRTLMNEEVGGQPESYKTLLMENNTEMEFAVVALSWRKTLACDEFTDASFDALRAFRNENVDSDLAPEPDFPWPYSGT